MEDAMKRARTFSWRTPLCLLAILFFAIVTIFAGPTRARVQAQSANQNGGLVIEGGTLIDGNGGAPVRDAVVVIEENKITAVATRGKVNYPANATIIRADGKFILPGLFDSQNSYSWYFGEAMLNHGVTSTIDVGTTGETAVPYREAVFREKTRGPRTFTGISRLSVNPNALVSTGLENPLTHTRVPKSAGETRQLVKAWIAAGADYILTYDGALPMDYYQAAFDEARKANIPVFARAYGPVLFPKDAAMLGASNLPHSAGIGIAVTKDPSKWRQGRDDRNELDRYAEMDDQKARDLIKVLVEHHVSLVPTFMINFPGYMKDWPTFAAETKALFSNPDLLAYYPPNALQSAIASYTRPGDQSEVRARREIGYKNAMRFHKMFVDAGGHIVVSGNTNDSWPPGVDLHQEMQVMAEVGLTPMQIIMGSTKYPAEMLRKEKLLGTIEAGKLADVIIVNADPLQKIGNLDKINAVIQDGKIIELGYHANYSSPFNNVAAQTVSVEGLPWAVAMEKATAGAEGGPQRGAENGPPPDTVNSPQPAIETMNPIIVKEGEPAVIKLTGFNFVKRSAVYFNGKPVPSHVAGPTEIEINLDTEALREAGRFTVVVKNPEPIDPFYLRSMWGNGTSNIAHLIVTYR
jgi:predicted amidohydrolase